MKKLYFTLLILSTLIAQAKVTIYYKNLDAVDVKLKVSIDGEIKEVVFKAGKKGKIVIKGKENSCLFYTSCEERKLNDGDEIEIVNACIKK
ncbi:MAG: hypothetical protein IPM51_00980 [Sphingobacteriaceae bacterium]|nr:hypothetical protein [Sphingobacteriaceae bacterium]